MSEASRPHKRDPYLPLRAAISCLAIGVAVVHIVWPHLQIDAITVTLLSAATVPWLQPIFKSVKLPGGFEVTLQELKNDVQAAAGAAQSAERKADLAVSNLVSAEKPEAEVAHQPSTELMRLARKYEQIRAEQTSGAPRTQAMTRLVRDMLASQTQVDETSRRELLLSDRAGDRLAAYVSFISAPDPTMLQALTHSVSEIERQPFGQYWGLQAISRNMPVHSGTNIPPDVLKALERMALRMPEGTDRHYEISKILRSIRQPTQTRP